MASSASAQTTLTVNGTGGSGGSCASGFCTTLSAAITQANADKTNDTIQFASTAYGTIDVTSTLDINTPMTINGPGANLLTLSGGNTAPIFDMINLSSTTAVTVTITGLTFAHGDPAINDDTPSATVTLDIDECAFTGSSVPGTASVPGISAIVLSNGDMTIANSTFSGNTTGTTAALNGFATLFDSGGTSLTVVNCTFVDNFNYGNFGATLADTSYGGSLTVVNSTFAGNLLTDVDEDNSSNAGSTTIENDIFADTSLGDALYYYHNQSSLNYNLTEGNNLFYNNAGGDVSSEYVTLSSTDWSSSTKPAGTNLDPMLTTLGYFGGSTETVMPEPNSAAIGNGLESDLTGVLGKLPYPLNSQNDQRGFPLTSAFDIGAVQTNYLLVNTPTGTAAGSLPAAITTASGQPYADIGFNLAPGTPAAIALSSTLSLTSTTANVAIIGPPGGLSISGGGAAQILSVIPSTGSSSASLALYGLTFTDGSATSADGGAINFKSSGFLSVGDCTFTGNSSTGGGAGAIADAGGVLAVNGSTFSGNQAPSSSAVGGAIAVSAGSNAFAWLSVVNSTFDGNSAAGTGGAIYGSMGNKGDQLIVLDSTFVDNSASNGSGAIDDSASTSAGPETVENDIFSGNTEGSSTNDYAVDLANNTGTVENYNLYYENYETGTTSESDTNVAPGTNDVSGSDPQLTALADFGGLTQTMMPEPGSKAIGAGSASVVPAMANGADQRGFPVTSAVDIGAVQTNYLLVTNANNTKDSTPDCTSGTGNTCSIVDAINTANTQNYTDIGFSTSLSSTNPTITTCIVTSNCGLSAPLLQLLQGNTDIVAVPGTVTIAGDSSSSTTDAQIFEVIQNSPVPPFLGLYGLTLEYSEVAIGNGFDSLSGSVNPGGTVAVTDCTFLNDGAYEGGAIFNAGGAVTVTGSTFNSDEANHGGAIANGYVPGVGTFPSATLTVTNSSFFFDGATIGGAIYSVGSSSNPSTLIVTNDTFAANSSGTQGSAIYNDAGSTMTLADNIIFCGNDGCLSSPGSSSDAIYNNTGTVASEGHNFFNDNYSGDTNFGYGGGDIQDPSSNAPGTIYPITGPADNGGPTLTTLPIPSGVVDGTAICAGTPNLPFGLALPTTDQRGFPRINMSYTGSPCVDIGSVQSNYQSIQFTNGSGDYTETAGQADSTPAPNISVTESGQNIGGIPVTLSVGNLTSPAVTGNVNVFTGAGTGATFSNLIVNTPGTYDLSSTLDITPSISIQTKTTPTLTVTGLVFTSAASTTFTVNQSNSFPVTATGTGTLKLSASGVPSWATFTDNGGGNAMITGKPKHPDVGTYTIIITASNGSTSVRQNFTLTVDLSGNTAPAFTSPANAAFLVNQFGTFTVTATGTPAPTLSETNGSLPTGLNFTAGANGTATVSGTPTQTGSDTITITATNGSGTVTQALTVTVGTTPTVITGITGSTVFTVGQPGSFTVTATGSPTPSLTESGKLPAGVTFTDNGGGTATISGAPKHHAFAGSPYVITVTASNGVSPAATLTITLTVNP